MGQRLYNLNDVTYSFYQAGVPKAKLGVSARPNGSVWRGGTGTSTGGAALPLQSYTTAPTMWNDVPNYYWYADVGKTSQQLASWPRVHDVATGATYLSNDESGSANDFFISYDDGWACMRKIKLVQDSLYGGVYCWTIDGMEQIGSRYPQADSLKAASTRGSLPGGQGHQDITTQALPPIALITAPTGSGSRNLEVIRDGDTPPVGSSDPSRQYDTYNGGSPRSFDWIGYTFPAQHTFAAVVFQEGMQFANGGWFDSLRVQVRVSGSWNYVTNLQSSPPYPGANGTSYETFELSFVPITGDGIRIAGTPGGTADYVSVAELRVLNNGATGVTPSPGIPRDYSLEQNYPNPFNPSTKMSFNLPVGSDVTLTVYNLLGQEIATLVNGYHAAGRYTVDFSADRMSNGIYFYSIRANKFSEMKKMVLLK
jgi:hypothetical protein